MPKRIPRAPLDFCNGVTCGFIFRTRFHALFTFEVDVNLRIDLVYAYNSMKDFVFNGRVEKYSMVCRRFESIALLLLETTMVVMFLLIAIKSLLKILP